MRFRSSPLDAMNRKSTLSQLQLLKNGGEAAGSSHANAAMAPVLPLTSLIDAFSIIVIYLLIGTQSGGLDSNLPNKITLPVAESGAQLMKEEKVTVRIEKGVYFINDQAVPVTQLGQRLAQIKAQTAVDNEEAAIIIQGDQKMDFSALDPLLKAGSEAGIQKLKFAVTPTK